MTLRTAIFLFKAASQDNTASWDGRQNAQSAMCRRLRKRGKLHSCAGSDTPAAPAFYTHITRLLLAYYAPIGKMMRILIVEDDPVLSDGLQNSLRRSDFAVDAAHDGEAANNILTTQNYDLIILDLGLPRLDGFEVLRRLRHRGGTSPVLILTARASLSLA